MTLPLLLVPLQLVMLRQWRVVLIKRLPPLALCLRLGIPQQTSCRLRLVRMQLSAKPLVAAPQQLILSQPTRVLPRQPKPVVRCPAQVIYLPLMASLGC